MYVGNWGEGDYRGRDIGIKRDGGNQRRVDCDKGNVGGGGIFKFLSIQNIHIHIRGCE